MFPFQIYQAKRQNLQQVTKFAALKIIKSTGKQPDKEPGAKTSEVLTITALNPQARLSGSIFALKSINFCLQSINFKLQRDIRTDKVSVVDLNFDFSFSCDDFSEMCLLSSGCVVMAHTITGFMSKLDMSNYSVQTMELKRRVLHMCETKPNQLAVAMYHGSQETPVSRYGLNKVAVIDTNRNMNIVTQVDLDSYCLGLAYINGLLYTCDHNAVCSYDLDKILLSDRLLQVHRIIPPLWNSIIHLSKGPGNTFLYLYGQYEVFLCCTYNVTTYERKEISKCRRKTKKVRCDTDGYIYTLDDTSSVTRHTPDGQKKMIPLQADVSNFCVDSQNQLLIFWGSKGLKAQSF